MTVLLGAGCAGSQGPEVLSIPSGQYSRAFDAALEVARSHGMQPTLQDRRTGVIETDSVIAGTVFEPWYQDTASFSQGLENTLAQYRMSARFEFIPAGLLVDKETASSPDLLGLGTSPVDLTHVSEPLELRVHVFREQRHTVGQRRHTWSRRLNSTSVEKPHDEQWEDANTRFWTPESRDESAERRLLAEVASDMNLPAQPYTANADTAK
ncbi:MAG: hypothetical protein MK095_00045 [Phycisphaerales bacterium]|nr:hypothetical protein [Phycisphaerales bacterium]